LKGPPQWGFGGHFGGRSEDIWWESTSVLIRYVLGVLYGENRPKSEKLANLTPRSSATVHRTEKLTGNSLALGLQRGVNSRPLYLCSASRDQPALSEVPV